VPQLRRVSDVQTVRETNRFQNNMRPAS
jgi:hypothetical protein